MDGTLAGLRKGKKVEIVSTIIIKLEQKSRIITAIVKFFIFCLPGNYIYGYIGRHRNEANIVFKSHIKQTAEINLEYISALAVSLAARSCSTCL